MKKKFKLADILGIGSGVVTSIAVTVPLAMDYFSNLNGNYDFSESLTPYGYGLAAGTLVGVITRSATRLFQSKGTKIDEYGLDVQGITQRLDELHVIYGNNEMDESEIEKELKSLKKRSCYLKKNSCKNNVDRFNTVTTIQTNITNFFDEANDYSNVTIK
ncbi:MAG: hypothetical protein V3V78_01020 [Candidatus Woesearchaeota archaeon]